jgi:hypothetical protein
VHTPAPILESPRLFERDTYGNQVLNPALGLAPGSKVMLTVRAMPRK